MDMITHTPAPWEKHSRNDMQIHVIDQVICTVVISLINFI